MQVGDIYRVKKGESRWVGTLLILERIGVNKLRFRHYGFTPDLKIDVEHVHEDISLNYVNEYLEEVKYDDGR